MSRPLPASIPALVTVPRRAPGAAFARRPAGRGHHVTLVARRIDRLEQLRAEFISNHDVAIHVFGADLGPARAGPQGER